MKRPRRKPPAPKPLTRAEYAKIAKAAARLAIEEYAAQQPGKPTFRRGGCG